MSDVLADINNELLDLTISLCGAPHSGDPFPPPNSKLIFKSTFLLRVATSESVVDSSAAASAVAAAVDLEASENGGLRILAPKMVCDAQTAAAGQPRPKRRRTHPQTPRVAIATLSVDPHDGSLCSSLRRSGSAVPLASALGPYIERLENGQISLVYGTALLADSTEPVRFSRQGLALQFLGRALDDPSLVDTQAFQAGPVDMLQMITRKPTENPPEIAPQQLKTALLPYQKDTVNWCLRREGKSLVGASAVSDLDPQIRDYVVAPPLGWRQLSDSEIWVNPYNMHTLSKEPDPVNEGEFAGKGLLAEEMGLGKTLEITSLILLNQRRVSVGEYAMDPISGGSVLKIKATLVIAPKSILTQWKHEITMHAPELKVMFYQGHEQGIETIDDLARADVVLTSYYQLALEVHNAVFNPHKRNTRHNLFKRPEVIEANRSKLVQVQFWRVILDEAQMIHTGVSSAALVARLVPRVHSWAVTGTPVKRSLEDLRGLLYFLDMQPFVAKHSWQRLIASPVDLQRTMPLIGMRHTKPLVAHQLFIPPQRRKLILLRFSEVERLRYERLVQRFEDEERTSNVNLHSWLMRLRQACSHATSSNSQSSSDHLLTIDQVLGQLVDETDAAVYGKQREMIVLELEKGQLLDKADNLPEAINVWSRVAETISEQLDKTNERLGYLTETADSKQEYLAELENRYMPEGEHEATPEPNVAQLQKENEVLDAKHAAAMAHNQVKSARIRRRAYQELLHRTLFFIGTGFFRQSQRLVLKLEKENIKTENFDPQVQDQLKGNSNKEAHYYELAEKLRTDILGEAADRVDQYRDKIKAPTLCKVTKVCSVRKAEIVDGLSEVVQNMTSQLLDILNQPLMEEKVQEAKPGEQVENDAYAKTLDLQEYAFSLLDTLQIILRDRAAAINGGTVQNMTPDTDEFVAELVARREELVPLLRHDRTPLVSILKTAGVDNRFIDELKGEVAKYQRVYGALRDLYNSRVEYYKQLQDLSDQVMDIDVPRGADLKQLITDKELSVVRTIRSIDALVNRQRYIRNLEGANHRQSQTRGNTTSAEACTICQEDYTVGSLAPCGHTFCFDCLHKWLSVKSTCPLCKRHTHVSQVITFKIGDTLTPESETVRSSGEEIASEIFSPISDTYYNAILREPIERMYGIKIDMIVRHMKHLRNEDPTAQVLVFSQWQSMLRVLRGALSENGIRAASMRDPLTSVDEFREDSRVACLLLHAKEDVAGLTLVNANHVYLCEPFLNTALELQAVSRVNRIGQTRETTVWQFCVENTVEQTILGMTTKQRLLDTAAVGMDSADSSTLAEAQAQGSLVDKKSGAEIVGDNVIREILFKKKKDKRQ